MKGFGAIPNDGKDDSKAIQLAIDHAISSSVSIVRFEAGIYDLEAGLVAAKQMRNGEFQFVTMHLSGPIPAYTSNQAIGGTAVLRYSGKGAALSVQSARNFIIENIVFEGNAPLFDSPQEISQSTLAEWGNEGRVSTSRYTPHCAIAIDPFHIQVPRQERYSGFDNYYSNISNGGSSMVSIRGCSFYRYYIAIANNPSNGVANGDNIRAENCHVSHCHTFWSAGQTQSRNNSIENVYALFLHTLVNGVQIGQRQGTPPFISNVNLAGYCEQVFNIHTLFSGLSVRDSYFESIQSLGIALVNSVSFSNCQIQFRIADDQTPAPLFHLFSNAAVHFQNCGLEFFDNCQTPAPFMFKAGALRISGGWIEGGIVAPNGVTNAGGEELHHVVFENVFIKCTGSIAGRASYIRPLVNLSNHILLGGESIQSDDGSVFSNTGNTFEAISLGTVDVDMDRATSSGTFILPLSGVLKVGDNLITGRSVMLKDETAKVYSIRPALGYVSEINGNRVIVRHVPNEIPSGKMELYLVDYPVFIPPLWGDISKGSPVIRNVLAYAHDFYPKARSRINMQGFPQGAYVKATDPSNRTITLSVSATEDRREAFIKSINYKQEIHLQSWDQRSTPVMREGALINLEEPWNGKFRYINTSKAIINTSHQPRLKALE